MQLIVRHDVEDYVAWRAAFDGDAEARGQAGLRLLQMWRDADATTRVWLLYDVADRRRADDYLSGLAKLHARQGGVAESERHFVRTA